MDKQHAVKLIRWVFGVILAVMLLSSMLFAVTPEGFGPAEIDVIWQELWKSGGQNGKAPPLDPLTEAEALKSITGRWVVEFGVMPDKINLSISTNHTVEVSGQKDGTAWKRSVPWKVMSDKLVFFLKEDSLPSFIFRSERHLYLFDPWSKTMKTEMIPEKLL